MQKDLKKNDILITLQSKSQSKSQENSDDKNKDLEKVYDQYKANDIDQEKDQDQDQDQDKDQDLEPDEVKEKNQNEDENKELKTSNVNNKRVYNVKKMKTTKHDTMNKSLEKKKPWNNRIKLLLKKLGEKSMGYRWMHEHENAYYLNFDTNINIAQLILGMILTVLNSTGLISLYAENNYVLIFFLTLSNLILSALLTFTIGLREKIDFRTISQNHKESAYRFTQIYHSIQEQLSLDIEDREIDKEFMRKMIIQYDDLMQTKQNIRKGIVNKYITETKNTNIYKPIIMAEFENIDIEDEHVVNIELDNIKNDLESDNKQKKINYEISRWLNNY